MNPDPSAFELDSRQRAMLAAMGVKVWSPAPTYAASAQDTAPQAQPAPRSAAVQAATHAPTHAPKPRLIAVAPSLASAQREATAPSTAHMDWTLLQEAVRGCRACGLCEGRTQTVFGAGSPSSSPGVPPAIDWLIVGEAPGEHEDAQGEPFVGQAGKLLDNMLAAVGLSRQDGRGGGVYIVNTLKCRPPANRNPSPQELVQCAPYLSQQIALLRPKVIVAMGRFAAQSLLKDLPGIETLPLGKLRGQVHRFGQTPVVVTYHPAYLLRSLADKAKAWEDLVLALGLVRSASPDA